MLFIMQCCIINLHQKGRAMPGVGLKEVDASRIFRRSVHEGDKVVSRTHRQALPLLSMGYHQVLISLKS
jgi:hypothetical protein